MDNEAARRLADILAQPVTLQDPPPGGCYWPLADPEPPAVFTDDQLAELQRRYEQATTPAAIRRHHRREMRRLLSRRTRLRLWKDQRILAIGVWLMKHCHWRAAVTLWRVTGYWKA